MALVTTSRRADLDVIHRHRTLLNHFEFTLAREDYTHSKPNPESYLESLARFGAGPDEAIVIEDSARRLRHGYPAWSRRTPLPRRTTSALPGRSWTRAAACPGPWSHRVRVGGGE